jgi:hypothetical protein
MFVSSVSYVWMTFNSNESSGIMDHGPDVGLVDFCKKVGWRSDKEAKRERR